MAEEAHRFKDELGGKSKANKEEPTQIFHHPNKFFLIYPADNDLMAS